MPSFTQDVWLFLLALLLFGPKKLPQLARELGKWVAEFRRASNEFKYQMEEELRVSEQEDRNKKIAAIEAAAPAPPAIEPISEIAEPEHPHLPPAEPAPEAVPIASSGDLNIMPPATGLPTARGRSSEDPLGGLIDSIPPANAEEKTDAEEKTETANHG